MSTYLESVVRDMLYTEKSAGRLSQILAQRLINAIASIEDRTTYINFIILSGHYDLALKIFAIWFENKSNIPIHSFCFLLHKIGFEPDAAFLDALFAANDFQPNSFRLQSFPAWECYDLRFIEIREFQQSQLEYQLVDKKESLLRKLEYYRASRMLSEEEKLLEELAVLYPRDNNIKDERQGFKERWAREIINQKSFDSFERGFNDNSFHLSADEKRIAEILTLAAIELIGHQPESAYNLAIMFYFLELYEAARKVLDLAPPSLSVDWLYLEVLIKSRRFVECLDAIESLEKRYADDPETTFGAAYYRAVTFAGLEQKAAAIELLKSIVSIRPSYRSAHALLHKLEGHN